MEKSKICITNRQIGFNFDIISRLECGIALKGTEIKSIRNGKCNLKDSFALVNRNEVLLKNVHISPYEMGNINNVSPTRDRKLLLHKKEILNLTNHIKQGGYTLVPSKIYSSGKWIKVELCLCKGKKSYDKREDLRKKDAKKQINAFKDR